MTDTITSRDTMADPDTCPICLADGLHSRQADVGILNCCHRRIHLNCAAPLQIPGNTIFIPDITFTCPLCRHTNTQLIRTHI